MGIIFKYFLQVIKRNWLSFILILVSLSLVSATTYINLSIDSDVIQTSENSLAMTYKGFDASLEFNDDEDGLAANTVFSKADRSLPFFVSYEKSKLENKSSIYVYQVYTKIEKVEDYNLISLSEGRLPAKENEILITEKKASSLSLSIGDEISLENRNLQICGYIEEASIFTNEFPNVLETIGLLSQEEKCNYFLFDYSCSQEEFLSSLPLKEGVEYSFNVFDSNDSNKKEELKIILALILVISAIIASFVIYSSLTMIINKQLPSIASFRSIGASKKRINALLLSEGILEGIFGGLIGVFLGELCHYLIYHFYLNGIGFSAFSSPSLLFVAFAFTLLLQLFTTIFALFSFHANSLKDNILGIKKGSFRFKAFLPYLGFLLIVASLVLYFANNAKNLALLLVSASFFFLGFILAFFFLFELIFKGLAKFFKKHNFGLAYLAANSLSKEKSNHRNALLISLVLSLSFISAFTTNSMNSFFKAYEERYNYSVMIRGQNGYQLTEKDCNYILKYADGVKHIVKEYWEYIDCSLNEKEMDRQVYFVKQNVELGGMNYLGRDLEKDPIQVGECLIDELFARHCGFSINEVVNVSFAQDSSSHSDFSFKIVGYCDSSIFNSKRDTIVLSEEDYQSHITTSIHKIGLQLEEGVSVSEILGEFKFLAYTTYGKNLKVEDASEYAAEEYNQVSRIITLLGFIPLFITILSVMGLVNNSLLLFEEKKKGYAVLASTCMDKKKICFLNLLEMLFMFISGAIFAFAFGSFLVFLIRDILYVLFCYVEIQVSILQILELLGITFLVLGIGFYFIAHRIRKMDIVKEIRYE